MPADSRCDVALGVFACTVVFTFIISAMQVAKHQEIENDWILAVCTAPTHPADTEIEYHLMSTSATVRVQAYVVPEFPGRYIATASNPVPLDIPASAHNRSVQLVFPPPHQWLQPQSSASTGLWVSQVHRTPRFICRINPDEGSDVAVVSNLPVTFYAVLLALSAFIIFCGLFLLFMVICCGCRRDTNSSDCCPICRRGGCCCRLRDDLKDIFCKCC